MTLTFAQEDITKYFTQTIQHHCNRHAYMKGFERSGYQLIDQIPRQSRILDVGCGTNLFKPWFDNLIGIDVIGHECDIQTSLLDYFAQEKFDVVLCLGSIFGSLDDIRLQVDHIKSMLRPGGKIYWRNHPAQPRPLFPEFFYPWTEQTHVDLSREFGFVLDLVCKESCSSSNPGPYSYRIYAEYTLPL